MKTRWVPLAGLLASVAVSLCAQAPTTTGTQVLAVPAAPAAPAGFRADYVAEVEGVGKQLVDLAQAMPADKYGWRPVAGVRSVGEVYMHIVAGNSTLGSFVGLSRMDGITRESEKTVTDKAKIVELLKRSIENAKAAAMRVSDADLDKRVKTFGDQPWSQRKVLLHMLGHMQEHLGQSIAYARMNGVTPPWSEASPAK